MTHFTTRVMSCQRRAQAPLELLDNEPGLRVELRFPEQYNRSA